MKSLIFACALIFVSASAVASPNYPWDSYNAKCASLNQNDGKRIGAICPTFDVAANTRGVVVYYFGYLQDSAKYGAPYANLALMALNGERYMRMGMAQVTLGNDRDLPAIQVYKSDFVLCGSFNCESMARESDFSVYFQAEQKHPTRNPPFEFDNLFEKNYRGHANLVPNF